MPQPWPGIAMKALLAAVFFFVLKVLVLKAPVEAGVVWAMAMGTAAAILAWSQANRR